MELNQLLKDHRKAKNLTQTQLAQKLNYHTQFVSNWERGLSLPPLSIMPTVAEILDIDIRLIKKLLMKKYSEDIDIIFKSNMKQNRIKK